MKIGELEMRCGECEVVDGYCGEANYYCLCSDERFGEIDEETYVELATGSDPEEFYECLNCKEDCNHCETYEESRDYTCRQIADYVFTELQKIKGRSAGQ